MTSYVYIISDPRTRPWVFKDFFVKHTPFYIGKGSLTRAKGINKNHEVNETIRQIKALGLEPHYTIIDYDSDGDAFEAEQSLSRVMELKRYGGILLNRKYGGAGGKLGQEFSLETRLAISERTKGKKNPFFGKRHTEESKQRNRIAHVGKPRKTYDVRCPHCNKVGGVSAMKRHHFDNCKGRPKG